MPRPVPTIEKPCGRCGVVKPLDAFYSGGRDRSTGARTSYCKPCAKEWQRERRALRPEMFQVFRLRRNLKRYGMTPESYEERLIAQGRRCAICATDQPGGNGRFHVDHCHSTGKIRGLLCTTCNTGLGHFGDDVALMARAIAYIEESKES